MTTILRACRQLFALGLSSGILFVSAFPVDAAFLDGKVMSVNLIHQDTFQSQQVSVPSGDFVVGPDVELRNFGFRSTPPLPALVDIDISDTQILITALINQPFAFREELHFSDANSTIAPITQANINPATNWAGLTPIRVSSSFEGVFVSLSQLSGLQGQQILLDIVPEPASAGLLLTAATAAAAIRRRYAVVGRVIE